MKRNNQDITCLMRNNRIVLDSYKNNVKCYDAFPSGYTKLDYISSDGDAYINTGFTFPSGKDDSIEFIINMFYNEYTTTNKDFVFGGRASSNSHNVSLGLNQNGGVPPINWAAVGAGNHAERYDSVSDEVPNTWYKYEILKDKLVRNGNTLWTYQSPRQYFYLEYPICLFGVNEAGVFQRHAKISIKDFEILDDKKTIHYFHAALRNSDNKPGMIDLVTGQFYTNQGSGEFTYWSSDYEEIEYIKNPGTCWIDTGFKPNQDTAIKVDAIYPNLAGDQSLFGVRTRSSSPWFECNKSYNSTETRYHYNTDWQPGVSVVRDGRETYYANKNVLTFSDQTITHTYATFSIDSNLYLFCSNINGSPNRYSQATIYLCMIWNNGTLVRKLKPGIRKADNKPGFYDMCNNIFYTNQGSGEFEYAKKWNGLIFEAEEANSTISYQSSASTLPDLKYSYNNVTWNNWSIDTTITLNNIGDKVYIKGNNPNGFNNYGLYTTFRMTGKIKADGDISSLLSNSDVTVLTVPNSDCFNSLFTGCSSLTKAPQLPALNLKDYCYAEMFIQTSIIETPKLPALNLTRGCYRNMFHQCEDLIKVSEIKATSLNNTSCFNMFSYCTNLLISDNSGTLFFTCPSTEGLSNPVSNMFYNTSGTYTDAPVAGHSYYYYQL